MGQYIAHPYQTSSAQAEEILPSGRSDGGHTERLGWFVQNQSTGNLYLGTAANVSSTANFFMKIATGALYESPGIGTPGGYTGPLYVIGDGTDSNTSIFIEVV